MKNLGIIALVSVGVLLVGVMSKKNQVSPAKKLSLQQVADYLGYDSIEDVEWLAKKGFIKVYGEGNSRYILSSELENLLNIKKRLG